MTKHLPLTNQVWILQGMKTANTESPKLPEFSYWAMVRCVMAVAISENFFRLTALESG